MLAGNPTIPLYQRKAYAGGQPVKTYRIGDLPRHSKPLRIGIQFMGDLFHSDVPFWMIDDVFDAMLERPWHRYVLLTKRPDVLWAWLDSTGNNVDRFLKVHAIYGFTAENQATLEKRGQIMLRLKRMFHEIKIWCSLEPLLGPISINPYVRPVCTQCNGSMSIPVPGGGKPCPRCIRNQGVDPDRLDWVIVGKETGAGARSAKKEWFDLVISDCRNAGAPVFVKKAPEGVEIIREYPI